MTFFIIRCKVVLINPTLNMNRMDESSSRNCSEISVLIIMKISEIWRFLFSSSDALLEKLISRNWPRCTYKFGRTKGFNHGILFAKLGKRLRLRFSRKSFLTLALLKVSTATCKIGTSGSSLLTQQNIGVTHSLMSWVAGRGLTNRNWIDSNWSSCRRIISKRIL
jgi:hypothetical protein